METAIACHYVTPADADHYNILYSARAAEWIIDCATVKATQVLGEKHFAFVAMKDMSFKKSVPVGAIVILEAKLAQAGRSSLTIDVSMNCGETEVLTAAIVFVCIDDNRDPMPHGVTL
ncbi:MAG: hypothetical protein K5637_07280 [Lachnospiraceae bacterium]|nr:hypothetical protein [Lachnospiraceae bacterium]